MNKPAVYKAIPEDEDGKKYELLEEIVYCSPRYNKFITVPVGYKSDGATGAVDLHTSRSFWVHDVICDRACWDDSTPITAWQAASVLSDLLGEEGRWFRRWSWKFSTFAFGCHKTRENGWW